MSLYLFHLAVFVLLAICSISLTAVEAAYSMLKRSRLSHLADMSPRAEIVNRFLADPPALLMPLNIGTYTAHVGMTVILASAFEDGLGHGAELAAFSAMIVYLLIFRLTVPYAIARRNPERILLVLAYGIDRYVRVLMPIVGFLRRRKVMGAPTLAQEMLDSSPRQSNAEVPPPPVREPDEIKSIEALERFSATLVRNVMTPRPDLVAISADTTVQEARRLMAETKYSRLPVYREDLDDIIGFITVRDMIEPHLSADEAVETFARAAYLVPETKRVTELMRELQDRRATFAMVIDEYGATAGLVTMEDIVEELVGEIKDEYDAEAEPIRVEPDGAIFVNGRVHIDRLEAAVETALCESEEVSTVGGFVAKLFGRIPKAGERAEVNGFEIEVLHAERTRVHSVRLRRLPPKAEEG